MKSGQLPWGCKCPLKIAAAAAAALGVVAGGGGVAVVGNGEEGKP